MKTIYTTLIGNYDTLKDPSVVDSSWDYICFSNHLKQKDFCVWQIKPIENNEKLSPLELSRYTKLMPHLFLPEYEQSIYIDSNIDITTHFLYERANELLENKHLISIPIHPTRDCIYEEIDKLIVRGKDQVSRLKKHYHFLEKEHYPKKHGLFENNVIYRKHKDSKIIALSELWWHTFLTYAKRDQLSFCYSLWKLNMTCTPFMPSDISDHRKCEHFYFSEHKHKSYHWFKKQLNKLR